MAEVVDETLVRARAAASKRGGRDAALSVCCMTSGQRPALLGGVLMLLREVADEIVVAVEATRADAVRAALAGVADKVLAFPPTAPADRPIAWLVRSCSRKWIFNVDDDEVPSPGLAGSLSRLVRRDDITHAWIARRWLHPTQDTYIASAPWGTEFQLRLVLADDRFLQFSDVFHRPLVCHGPAVYVDEPLWHLDTVLNPAAHRRLKAAAYERERPGMRLGGLSHNLGIYVPELHPDLELRPVPDDARSAIAAARAYRPQSDEPLPPIEHATSEEVDRDWVGPPYSESLYRATVTVSTRAAVMTAGVQYTVDVRVRNRSDVGWRWGPDARPAVRLGYRWRREGVVVHEPAALRTTLPADLAPRESQLIPVHVVAPETQGQYELELDLVHEPSRWFGAGTSIPVTVHPRRTVSIVAGPERVSDAVAELGLAPAVEPVVVLRDPVDAASYAAFASVVGLRRYLLAGSEERGRLGTLGRIIARTVSLTRATRRTHWSHPEYASLLAHMRTSDRLVVDGPNWQSGAAFGREWAWVGATALLWRSAGKPVAIPDAALPGGSGIRIAAVRALLKALRTGT